MSFIAGTLIKRYKRFLVDIQLDETGTLITAHCPNSGSMLGVKDPGSRVWVSFNPSPKRKLSYTWEIASENGIMVGVNTQTPNRLIGAALREGLIAPFANYTNVRAEVPYDADSRIDFLLQQPGMPDCYVEVKNVHLNLGGFAAFPDSVTTRGQKHMQALERQIQLGHRAAVIYVVQRFDLDVFTLAHQIDPDYASYMRRAHKAGVDVLALKCHVDTAGVSLDLGHPMALYFN